MEKVLEPLLKCLSVEVPPFSWIINKCSERRRATWTTAADAGPGSVSEKTNIFILETIRSRNIVVIFCGPSMFDLYVLPVVFLTGRQDYLLCACLCDGSDIEGAKPIFCFDGFWFVDCLSHRYLLLLLCAFVSLQVISSQWVTPFIREVTYRY